MEEQMQAPAMAGAKREFKIGEAVSFGWDMFKKNYKFLLILSLAYMVIVVVEEIIKVATHKATALYLLIFIAALALNLLIGIGIIKIFLKVSRGGSAMIEEIFGGARYFWKYLGGTLLYMIIIFFGMILLIVPGIIWSIKYGMFQYLIVDKDMSPVAALKESGRITQGNKWKLFLLYLVTALITSAGIMLLGIGVLVAFPVVSLALAYVYRILVGEDVRLPAENSGPSVQMPA